jgi:hypothetical protein
MTPSGQALTATRLPARVAGSRGAIARRLRRTSCQLVPCPMFHRASESGTGAGKLAARPTERAARVCRRSRPIENVSGPDFSAQRKSRCASGQKTAEWGDVEICRETLDKTTCPVPVPPADQLARDVTETRSRSTISVVHARMASAVARRARIAIGRKTRRYFHSATKWCFEQDRFSTPRHACPFFRTGRSTEAKSQSIVRSPGRGGTPIATRRKPVVEILRESQKPQRGDTLFIRAGTVSPRSGA